VCDQKALSSLWADERELQQHIYLSSMRTLNRSWRLLEGLKFIANITICSFLERASGV
jgi:hypothetical protein